MNISFRIDGIENGVVSGWATDLDDPNLTLSFYVLFDGEESLEIVCDQPRIDLEKAGFPFNSGFEFVMPDAFLDDEPHRLEFRNQHYSNGPIPFAYMDEDRIALDVRQRRLPRAMGNVDGLQNGMLVGWVLRENLRTRALEGGCTVLITCEGEKVMQVRANRQRPDVASAHSADPCCGFRFRPPVEFRRSYPQEFRVFLVPDQIEIAGSPYRTSFLDDPQEEQLFELVDVIDQMHRDIVKLRHKLLSTLPAFHFTIDDYDRWAPIYQGMLHQRFGGHHFPRPDSREAGAPLVSIICPTFRPNLAHFTSAVESVIAQTYENWELVIADDGSNQRELTAQIEAFQLREPRIRGVRRAKNGGISAATNAALRVATGKWIAFLDHDDLLDKTAVAVMVAEAERTGAKVLYSDEDKINEGGYFEQPAFKPNWNYRYLLGVNYICHFLMVERKLVDRIGKFNKKFDGAQDHDFVLRLAEVVAPEEVHHVPEILYHWRISASSTAGDMASKPYVIDAGRTAVDAHLRRMDKPATVTNVNGGTFYRVSWDYEAEPRVTIIIPFKDNTEITRRCIKSILDNTKYSAYDLILVDNWSVTDEAAALCEQVGKNRDVRVIRVEEPFNYSRLNNIAAKNSDAEFFVFLNNDVFVEQSDWLRIMVGEALADEQVAIVGAKLLYPEGTVQHGGVVLGLGGVAGHVHSGLTADAPGYLCRAILTQELSAVTAACMLMRASVFREVGGFDEHHLKVAFNDIDLCLKAGAAGYKVVWSADVVAEHHESLSRGLDDRPGAERRFWRECEVMRERWGNRLLEDPHYSQYFSLKGRPFYDLVGNEGKFPKQESYLAAE